MSSRKTKPQTPKTDPIIPGVVVVVAAVGGVAILQVVTLCIVV